MMYQKSKFPLTYIHEVNCQVICSESVSIAGNPSPVNLAAFKIVCFEIMIIYIYIYTTVSENAGMLYCK